MTITIFRTLMLFGLSVLVGSLTSYPTLATTDYGFTGKLHYNIVSILARF